MTMRKTMSMRPRLFAALNRRPATTNPNNTRWLSSLSSSSSSSPLEFDVLIVGGGVVGMAVAQNLQHLPLSIGLIEAGPFPDPHSPNNNNDSPPHPRSYALSPASLDIVKCSSETHMLAGRYDSMQVWESAQPSSLVFHAKELNRNSNNNNENIDSFLGCCVEDSVLRQHLMQHLLQSSGSVQLFPKSTWQTGREENGWMHGTLRNNSTDQPSDTPVRTQLLVAADGGRSQVRTSLGIGTKTLSYGQTALTFTVSVNSDTDTSNNKRAYQRFLDNGLPLAVLPTRSNQHRVIVWTLPTAEAESWKGRDPATILVHLNDQLQTGPQAFVFPDHGHSLLTSFEKVLETIQYGLARPTDFRCPPMLNEIASSVYSFPLSSHVADQFTTLNNTACLVGDSGHTMHPLAGQGLNLGLQDVHSLVTGLERAVSVGMPLTTYLPDYNQSRQFQVSTTLAAIHTLQRTFAQSHHVAKHVKSLGMSVLQSVPPLRRQVMQAACHGVASA